MANPYHDEKGRFTTADGSSGTIGSSVKVSPSYGGGSGRVNYISKDQKSVLIRDKGRDRPIPVNAIVKISGRGEDDVPQAKYGGMSRNELRSIMKMNAGPGYKAGAYKGYDRNDASSRRNNPR